METTSIHIKSVQQLVSQKLFWEIVLASCFQILDLAECISKGFISMLRRVNARNLSMEVVKEIRITSKMSLVAYRLARLKAMTAVQPLKLDYAELISLSTIMMLRADNARNSSMEDVEEIQTNMMMSKAV